MHSGETFCRLDIDISNTANAAIAGEVVVTSAAKDPGNDNIEYFHIILCNLYVDGIK